MRRLPVYLVLDTSGSMFGEPIEALNNALSEMINMLRTDPQAVDSLWISIITFNREVAELVPLTDLVSFQLPQIKCPRSGPTHTGLALEVLYDKITQNLRKNTATERGDWKPLFFLFTDGKPSDLQLYNAMIPKIKTLQLGAIIACAAGPQANSALLLDLTPNVVRLETADGKTLKQFFRWVSESIEQGNKSQGTGESVSLPPPPAELNLVI